MSDKNVVLDHMHFAHPTSEVSHARHISKGPFALIATVAVLAVMVQQTMRLDAEQLADSADGYEAPDIQFVDKFLTLNPDTDTKIGNDLIATRIDGHTIIHSRYVYPSKPCS